MCMFLATLFQDSHLVRSLLPLSLELQSAASQSDQFQSSTSSEATIQTIFKSLLHVTSLSISSDFFSLGGNSLLAIKTCFQTCAAVCALNSTEGPLSCEQEAMYILQSLEPESDGLLISVARYSTSSISAEKLREAVKVRISRHPSLRMVFHQQACAAQSQEVLDINSSKVLKLAESGIVTIDCSKECRIKFQYGGVHLPQLILFNFDLNEGPLCNFSNVTSFPL